jgi:hypothetical protein
VFYSVLQCGILWAENNQVGLIIVRNKSEIDDMARHFLLISLFGRRISDMTTNRRNSSTFLLGLFLVYLLLAYAAAFADQAIPKFKISATVKSLGTVYALLVPKETTNAQLEALVLQFRESRKSGHLSQFIPPTTKGGIKGDYAGVEIYIFTEQEWSSNPKFAKFMQTSTFKPREVKFAKEFCKHIKAYYLYPLLDEKHEIGSVGYYEHNSGYGKGQCTTYYKRLF